MSGNVRGLTNWDFFAFSRLRGCGGWSLKLMIMVVLGVFVYGIGFGWIYPVFAHGAEFFEPGEESIELADVASFVALHERGGGRVLG